MSIKHSDSNQQGHPAFFCPALSAHVQDKCVTLGMSLNWGSSIHDGRKVIVIKDRHTYINMMRLRW